MPRTCSKCGEVKSSAEFALDRRNKSGREHRCQECKNKANSVLIECENCGKEVQKRDKAAHMRTAKCLAGKQPWQQFKSNGTAIVKCTCGHKNCKVKVTEKNAYRHLKYGFRVSRTQVVV
jgi:hypothetical protein